jgi:hypothetical protein
MKNAAIVLGIAMFLGGLVALFLGLTSLAATPCFPGEDCTSGPDTVFLFPIGLIGVILGSILWTAAAGQLAGGGSATRNPLASLGFFGIFGLTFLGIGVVMYLADQQPTTDHTTNVLTLLGIIFSVVGIGSIVAAVVIGRNTAAGNKILATGLRGRATVLAVRDTGVTVNMSPMVALDLRVEIPGQPVFTKTVHQVISRLDVGDYRPGLVLSVAANPAKPQDIVVDWDNSPIGAQGMATDPVTGRPIDPTTAGSIVVPGSVAGMAGGTPMMVYGNQAAGQPVDLATILRNAADQIESGGSVSHPGVASAVSVSHQWSSNGQPMSNADIADILRTAATKAQAGQYNVGTGAAMSQSDIAALLRQASAAAAQAADAADARAAGLPAQTSRPTPPAGSGPTTS